MAKVSAKGELNGYVVCRLFPEGIYYFFFEQAFRANGIKVWECNKSRRYFSASRNAFVDRTSNHANNARKYSSRIINMYSNPTHTPVKLFRA
jgi:hypothetical protein